MKFLIRTLFLCAIGGIGPGAGSLQAQPPATPVAVPTPVVAPTSVVTPTPAESPPSAFLTAPRVFCVPALPATFNPQRLEADDPAQWVGLAFDRLLDYDRESRQLRPALAESWQMADDGLSLTVRLRPGVSVHSTPDFTPSRPLTADDVVFSFEKQRAPDHPFHNVGGRRYPGFSDFGLDKRLSKVEAVDARTVRFSFQAADPGFLPLLAQDFAVIVSAEQAAFLSAQGQSERLEILPAGTGPYQIMGRDPEGRLALQAFRRHWRNRPPLPAGAGRSPDSLLLQAIPEPALRYARLANGRCDGASDPDPAELPAIGRDPQVRSLPVPGFQMLLLVFDVTRKPFDDARVRQAIAAIIDRPALVREFLWNAGRVLDAPLPPDAWPAPETPAGSDLLKARERLLEAGQPNGFAADLRILGSVAALLPDTQRLAERLQIQLAQIGVRVRIRTGPPRPMPTASRSSGGEPVLAPSPQLYLLAVAPPTEPLAALSRLLGCPAAREGGGNSGQWCLPAFDAALSAAAAAPAGPAREQALATALDLLARYRPVVPLAAIPRQNLLRSDLPAGLHLP